MSAKLTFFVLGALGAGLGFSVGMAYYSSQIGSLHEQLNAKDGLIARYRVALGIDPASKGALVELTNQELALKAQSIVPKLRQLAAELNSKAEEIDRRKNSGVIDAAEQQKEKLAAAKEVSRDFNTNLASEASNVENELRKRLDATALARIIRIPAFVENDDLNSRITIMDIVRGSGFDAYQIGNFANEIEQMAKLLPPDSPPKQ